MWGPNKDDPEKGQQEDERSRRPSVSEDIGNVFSKAGEGIASVLSKAGEGVLGAGGAIKGAGKKAGEGILGAGEAIKDVGKKAGEGILGAGEAIKDVGKKVGDGVTGLVKGRDGEGEQKKKQKKNPDRAKQEKQFHKNFRPVPREEPKDTNVVGNITKLLPANTFLMFQTLAPLSTNDGNCHSPEIAMTGLMLFVLALTCMLVCFTDTVQFNGKVYSGLVTRSGLWNPSFKGDPAFVDLRRYEFKLAEFYASRKRYKEEKREALANGWQVPPRPVEPEKPQGPHILGSTFSSGTTQFQLKFTDFLHAVLSAMAFATLTMFTNPVSTCFYPNIPSTVSKTLPLLVGFIISAIFAFSPPARNGIAHPLPPRVASQMDHYKPEDPKGLVHAPQLPPKPSGKGDLGAAKPHGKDDDDDDGLAGSAKRLLGKMISGSDHDGRHSSGHHIGHGLGDGVMALASGFFNKHGDEIKQGVAKEMKKEMDHLLGSKLGDEMKKDASLLLSRAAPGVNQLGKEFRPALAQIQEIAKTPEAEALMTSLISSAGAGHPALAAAAQSAYAQGAKDAALKIHQDIQTATSAPLAGLSRQSSLALTPANSVLQSAGSSLSVPSEARDALLHQAAQVLQHSGLAASPILHSSGSEAAIALATRQALVQGGFLPGTLSPQAHALSAYAQGVGNLNLSAANALVKDVDGLVQQGGKSLKEVQDELAKQQSAFTQGVNAQMQTMYNPGASVAQDFTGLIHSGSQTLNQIQNQVAQQQAAISQGAFATNLASAVAREAATLLQEGANHGMTGVQDELARQRAAVVQRVDTQVQSIAQPVSSLAQDATSLANQGSQAMGNAKSNLLKQKEVLTQELNTQVRALSTPATSVAQDIAALGTPGSQGLISQVSDAVSQKLIEEASAQAAESLARGMARGMSMKMQVMPQVQEYTTELQPPASVAIDVASLLQQGSQMHMQLATQQSALSQGLNAAQVQAAAMLQPQAFLNQTHPLHTAQQVVEAHLRQLASLPPAALVQPAASLTVNALVESQPVQQMAESSQRLNTNAGLVIEEVTDAASRQASAMAPSTSRIWRERPESTEITDAISTEEITSESETEGRGEFRAGPFSSQVQMKKK